MKMIGHKTVGVDLPTCLFTDTLESIQEKTPIAIAAKNWLTPVSAILHVIKRAGIFEPQWSSHLEKEVGNLPNS